MKLNDAIRNGDQQAVLQAIAEGKDLDRIPGGEEMAFLMVAPEQGQIEIVRLLIQAGANVNLPDRHNHTALTHAVVGNRPEIFRLLIAARAELDRVGAMWPHNSPLMFAVMKGRATIARVLLDGGADMDAAASALHWAASRGVVEVAQLLRSHGANPRQIDERGRTPVTCAARFGHYALMDDLIRGGGTLDPLAEIYAELREFPARVQASPFVDAVKSLTELFGTPARQMEGLESVHYWPITAKGEVVQQLRGHASAHPFVAEKEVRQAKVDGLITRARQVLASAPMLVLDLCETRGCGDAQIISLIPSQTPIVAVAAVGTYGNEQELSNVDLVEFLLKLKQTDPFEITAARCDTLKLRFLNEVRDPLRLARSLYDICSDVIHQGYGTMDKLVEAIRVKRCVTLWWD